jgi:hypothetical protein
VQEVASARDADAAPEMRIDFEKSELKKNSGGRFRRRRC